MLIDFRGGIRVFPQTCPRGLVFRLQQPKNEVDCANIQRVSTTGAVGVEASLVSRSSCVVDTRRSDLDIFEVKMGTILKWALPKVGGDELILRVASLKVVQSLNVSESYDVGFRRDPVSGGIVVRFDAFTLVVQDFAADVNVKTPIETGTFARDESPPQTAWERLVAED